MKRQGVGQDQYGLVLALLVAGYLLGAFTTSGIWRVVTAAVFGLTLSLALLTSRVEPRFLRPILAALGASLAVVVVVAVIDEGSGAGLASAWASAVLLTILVVVVGRVLRHPRVTLQTIFGALSAYLLIGLTFAAWYGVLEWLLSGPFFADGTEGTTKGLQYFSFVTLTTLGYGDLTAASDAGRAVATLEALVGQIFLATLVARLVATFARHEVDEMP